MQPADIDDMWQEGNLPMVNGIISQKVCVTPFTIIGYGAERKFYPALAYGLNDYLKHDDAVVSSVDPLCELILKDRPDAKKAICGEGSYGGDGFVAVLGSDDTLYWVAAFACSNPFIKLTQRGGELIAISNNEEQWIFPLSDPVSFYVLYS